MPTDYFFITSCLGANQPHKQSTCNNRSRIDHSHFFSHSDIVIDALRIEQVKKQEKEVMAFGALWLSLAGGLVTKLVE